MIGEQRKVRKVLIVGAHGFIGSHCREHFTKENYEVWSCDIRADQTIPNYFQIDTISGDFKSIFSGQTFDACINCSGAANVVLSFEQPLLDFSANVLNVIRMLDAIRLTQPQCLFLNLSSAAVYGNPERLPVAEKCSTHPLSPYGVHKLISEMVLEEYHRFYNLATCSARIFSAYGPGLKKQLFWDWHRQIQSHKYLKLLGTGKESRDFIFITDLVSALELIVNKAPFRAEVINIASGREYSLEAAIQLFRKEYFEPFEFSFSGSSRKGDPLNWSADISALEKYGFKPIVDLKEGLKNYIEWLQKELG
jgi:UDP-glucose 4-epimerase